MAGSQAVSIKIVSFRGIESEFILSQNGDYDIAVSYTHLTLPTTPYV